MSPGSAGPGGSVRKTPKSRELAHHANARLGERASGRGSRRFLLCYGRGFGGEKMHLLLRGDARGQQQPARVGSRRRREQPDGRDRLAAAQFEQNALERLIDRGGRRRFVQNRRLGKESGQLGQSRMVGQRGAVKERVEDAADVEPMPIQQGAAGEIDGLTAFGVQVTHQRGHGPTLTRPGGQRERTSRRRSAARGRPGCSAAG